MAFYSRLVPHDELMAVALEAAETIAGYSIPSVMAAKKKWSMRQWKCQRLKGCALSGRLFHALFATQDQKEGMSALLKSVSLSLKISNGVIANEC